MGLGCVFLGDPFGPTDEACMQKTLATAWDEGLRYFDTAPWYGNTKSEHRLGFFLRQQLPGEYTISTKVGRTYGRPADLREFQSSKWMERWKGGLEFDLTFDYSGDAVKRSYEDSLNRMGLNTVDALAIHDLDLKHHSNWETVNHYLNQLSNNGGYKVLEDLKDGGEIKAIGVGVNHIGMIPVFLERFQIDYFLVAMPYTLLDQPVLDEEFELCRLAGVDVIVGSVFASGLLATGSNSPGIYNYDEPNEDVLERVRKIETVCKCYDVTLGAAALQFPLAHPVVRAVIPGADNPARMRENIINMHRIIPLGFWQDLKDEKLIRRDAPTPF